MNLPPPSARQARVIWLALTGLSIAVLVALVAGLVWGLGRVLAILSPVVWPLAVAGVLAYLLDPVVDFIERRGLSRGRAIACVFAVALMLMAGLCASIVPQLISETRQLAARIPDYANRLEQQIETWVNNPPRMLRRLLEHGRADIAPPRTVVATNETGVVVSTNAPAGPNPNLNKERLRTATGWLTQALSKAGLWLAGKAARVVSWFGVIAGLALIPVYTFYFLLEKRGISSRWTDYLPVTDSSFKQELVFMLNSINNYLIVFFRGQVLVALCDGILYGLGFLAVGVPYALLIGAAAVVLTIIPFIGAIIVCCTALIIALVQYGDWLHPLLVLLVFGLVQALEGLVISPRIMGGRVGLHPVTIIVAVMAGTTLLGGLLGGILAIPLTAALRVAMFRYVWKRKGRA